MSESYLDIAGNSLFLSALTFSTIQSEEQARRFTKIKTREIFREIIIPFLYEIASMKKRINKGLFSLYANI